jgi:hypothetical protein
MKKGVAVMTTFRRHFGKELLIFLFFVVLLIFSGGCGGSDNYFNESGKRTIYVLGELHGDLADEIAELVDCVPFTGLEAGAPLLISHASAFAIDAKTASAARALLEDGQAIGVEHASEDEVNALLDALGFEHDFRLPTGNTYVEFYGVKLLNDGDLLSYVALNDDEQRPVEIDELADSVMIDEGLVVSHDEIYDHLSADIADDERAALEAYGFVVSGDDILSGDRVLTVDDLISGDYVLTPEDGWIPLEGLAATPTPETQDEESASDAMELDMAHRIVAWLFSSEEQAEDALRGKEEVRRALAEGGQNLTDVARKYEATYDASDPKGGSFSITVEAYACHSFNTYDNVEYDWFYVKQMGRLNPGSVYRKYKYSSIRSMITGYIVDYTFDNRLVDANGNAPGGGVLLYSSSPEGTVGSSGTSSSFSFDISGNVGYSDGFEFGVSPSLNITSEQNSSVPDCQVTNNSNAGGPTGWVYSFTRPHTDGVRFMSYSEFVDAPAAARSEFEPINQWVWRISPEQRDRIKGFDFTFRWKNGYSYGESYVFGKPVYGVEHFDNRTVEKTFSFIFPQYPPLIAANKLTFYAEGGRERLTMATFRDWTAESDSAWCQINLASGDRDDIDNVVVKVDANTTGEDRTAYITLKTVDGKGSCRVKVFQAKF